MRERERERDEIGLKIICSISVGGSQTAGSEGTQLDRERVVIFERWRRALAFAVGCLPDIRHDIPSKISERTAVAISSQKLNKKQKSQAKTKPQKKKKLT